MTIAIKESALTEDGAAQKSAVVVLGADGPAATAMSCLLECSGCDVPASGRGAANRVAEFNKAMLQSSGTLIDHWAAFNARWLSSPKATQFLKQALDLLQAEFNGSYLSVIQDGHMARLLPFWNRVFDRAGIVPRYLFVISDPAEFSEDLNARLAIEERMGHLIWLRAMLDAEVNSRGWHRAFVCSAKLGRDPAKAISSLSEVLKIGFPRDVQTAFATEALRLKEYREFVLRSEASGRARVRAPTSDWVAATSQILTDWASNGETAEGRAVLDAIREAFDEAAPLFLGVGEQCAAPNSWARGIGHEQEAAHAETAELRKSNEALAQALADAQDELSARYGEIVTLTRMLSTETSSARRAERSVERMAAIARLLERGPTNARNSWLTRIMPRQWQMQRVRRLIKREGLFDADAYLAANPDVESAGADPLQHYLAHGAIEGRPLGTG